MKEKILFCWSGGKDSAIALRELRSTTNPEICAMLTTITKDFDRISMHGVRRKLLEAQVKSIGLPLEKVFISTGCVNADYEAKMQKVLEKFKKNGTTTVAFGDIFLRDIKNYREKNLSKVNLKAVFPIWKENTKKLADKFIETGFKAVICCVDSKFLDKSFCGREFDKQFLEDLPSSVDPCGENGEFHTFVFDGPIFKEKIEIEKGEIVLRDNRFYFCDLLPLKK